MIKREDLFKKNPYYKEQEQALEKEIDEQLIKTRQITRETIIFSVGSYDTQVIEKVLDKYVSDGGYSDYVYKETFDRISFINITLYL